MLAIFLAVHLFGIVGYTILLRKSALGKADKMLTSTLMLTACFLPSLVWLALGEVSFVFSLNQWLFLILGGIMGAGLMITNVWALSHLDASLFSIIYNLRLLLTTILAYILLGELPKSLQIVGGVVILVSVFMLNIHKAKKWKEPAILIGLFSMVWFSFHAVLEKYNLRSVPIKSYIFILTGIGLIILWSIVLIKRINLRSQLEHVNDRQMFGLMLTRSLSFYGYVFAVQKGSVAVVNYVSGLSVALIVLVGITVLDEKDQLRQKLFAVGIALIGLTLILISKL